MIAGITILLCLLTALNIAQEVPGASLDYSSERQTRIPELNNSTSNNCSSLESRAPDEK
jgi:hypothetical protein